MRIDNNMPLNSSVFRSFFGRNYLEKCQIATPHSVVSWVWKMAHDYRNGVFKRVLDLGCGDARFSLSGVYGFYQGVEIDESQLKDPRVPKNADVVFKCALLTPFSDYDLCIGNPPYVRHHDMDPEWQRSVANHIASIIGMSVDLRANAFLYFMVKALISVKDDGLIALVVPFEWVARPSSKWVRDYIERNKWDVRVYRLPERVFSSVLTTASLTIIDKSRTSGRWEYFSVDNDFNVSKVHEPSGTVHAVLRYSGREEALYAQRGLSPGTQKIFCLTEEERLRNRLEIGKDVSACVTSLKRFPGDFKMLTKERFYRYFVNSGSRCWLVRSDKERISSNLQLYLDSVDPQQRDTATCNNREIWYKYKLPDPPRLLFSTGFVSNSPQVLENTIEAVHVGGVGGIYGWSRLPFRKIAKKIRDVDFSSQVVHHSNALRKIEINQMNTILKSILGELHG